MPGVSTELLPVKLIIQMSVHYSLIDDVADAASSSERLGMHTNNVVHWTQTSYFPGEAEEHSDHLCSVLNTVI